MAIKYKNIVGTAFPPYVKDQLNLRSSKGGKNSRTPDELQYLTNRNAYFRLSSAASTGTEKTKEVKKENNYTSLSSPTGTAQRTLSAISGKTNPNKLQTEGEIIDYKWDTKLARENVLQGGIIEIQELVDEDDNKTYKEKQKKGFSETYNQGVSDKLGLQPMPGITGITIGTGGKWQTLMQADIEFICYNLDQLNIMSKLYMSLGVNLFLEWGHIPYFDNGGNLNSNQQFLDFFNTNDKEKLLKTVTKKRRTTDGNYDAFLGTVYNFSYQADKDGAYHCKTQIMGAGGMVESLKINSSFNYDFTTGKTDESEKFTSTLDNIFYTLKQFLRDAKINETKVDLSKLISGETTISQDFGHVSTNNFFKEYEGEGEDLVSWGGILNSILGASSYTPYYFDKDGEKGEVKYNNNNAKYGNATQIITDRCNQDVDPECELNDNLTPIPTSFYTGYASQYEGEGKGTNAKLDPDTVLTYITFGHLISLVQNFGIFVETSSKNVKQNNNTKPSVYIDYNPDNTLINVGPISATINPYKVFVPFSDNSNYDNFFKPLDVNESYFFKWLAGDTPSIFHNLKSSYSVGIRGNLPISLDRNGFVTENKKGGKLFNILINLDFARDCLKSTTNEAGDVSLIEYITKILDGINESLGGVNNLRTFIDESGMILRIVDEKVHNKVEENDILELKTFGKNSTVYDSSYSSAITPKLAAQIVIATQALTKGGIKDFPEDVLSYTSLNDNTKDRFSVYKYPPVLTEYGEEQQKKADLKRDKEILASLRRLYDHIFYVYTKDYYKTFGNVNKQICQDMVQPYLTLCGQKEKQQPIGGEVVTPKHVLIPLEYTITMDGISGILPYNVFKIPNDRLPKRYRDRVAFVVFSINHSFDNNNWRTTLRGQTIMLDNVLTPVTGLTIKGTGDPAPSRSGVITELLTENTTYKIDDSPNPVDTTNTGEDEQIIIETTTPDGKKSIKIINDPVNTSPSDINAAFGFIKNNEVLNGIPKLKAYRDKDFTISAGFSWRIGFGSDTITRSNGTVESVIRSSKITTQEAINDLKRRINEEFKPKVVSRLSLRGVNYNDLPLKVKVVFLDLAYNYGTLFYDFIEGWKKNGIEGVKAELRDRIRRFDAGELGQVKSRRQAELNYLNG